MSKRTPRCRVCHRPAVGEVQTSHNVHRTQKVCKRCASLFADRWYEPTTGEKLTDAPNHL